MRTLFKFEHHFLVNGDWENLSNDIRDRVPEKDDIFYVEGKAYVVIDIKEQEDNYLIFDIFLD